jgi:hypothetical protein
MRKAHHYDVRCYDLPESISSDCRVNSVPPDPAGTAIWRYRIECLGEKSFNALMQQLDLQRIAYDIRIVPSTKGEKKKSKLLKILKPLFLSLILLAVIASGGFLAASSPEVRHWLAGLEQNGVLPGGTRSFINHLSPLAGPEN